MGHNLPSNFPVIDRFSGGVATSIKSIDLGAKTYQRISALKSKVKGYIEKVSKFDGDEWGGHNVQSSQITSRALELVVPHGSATTAQQAALQDLISYGKTLGVDVKIIPFK